MWEKHDKTMKSNNSQNVFLHFVLCTNTDLKRIEKNGMAVRIRIYGPVRKL